MNSEFHSLALLAARARKTAMEIANRATTGHLGGSYSCTEILTALYFRTLRIDPENPKDPDRDRFVLSKGHATPVIYPILSMRGFFPAEELQGYRSIDSRLSGQITVDVPGVDMSTGSLSIGASTAVGMAMAGKYDQKAYRVYTLVGDGECEEGQIWEAFMAASKYALDNLCAIIDVNGLQIDGPTSVVMPSEPLDEKLEAFGFYVIRIEDTITGRSSARWMRRPRRRADPRRSWRRPSRERASALWRMSWNITQRCRPASCLSRLCRSWTKR